ncbi:hypothetical protein PR048_014350 [Dryococelus australis]|uniref:Uncharacterized protein n=1 Tax=Dryococelus australis TaxID=614101 RepID=A0ABQ9HE24_9NEOP|nr:hypothetical protein PR048_014350 [Dryococelus australis]
MSGLEEEVKEIVHQVSEEQRRPLNVNNISVPRTSVFSPEIVLPFPKERKRRENSRRRLKRKKTAILTDTPEKKDIEEK